MNFNGWSSFEDFARACGYSTSNNNTDDTDNSDNNNNNNEHNNLGCDDIPNGFQSLHPELFVIIGEILGAIMAGNLPFNLQNAIGNWFELLGQVILTYNSQQQYYQSGPGRRFSPENFNVTNPFSPGNSTGTSSPGVSDTANIPNNKKSSNQKATSNSSAKIEELEKEIKRLSQEISEIKKLLENKK